MVYQYEIDIFIYPTLRSSWIILDYFLLFDLSSQTLILENPNIRIIYHITLNLVKIILPNRPYYLHSYLIK